MENAPIEKKRNYTLKVLIVDSEMSFDNMQQMIINKFKDQNNPIIIFKKADLNNLETLTNINYVIYSKTNIAEVPTLWCENSLNLEPTKKNQQQQTNTRKTVLQNIQEEAKATETGTITTNNGSTINYVLKNNQQLLSAAIITSLDARMKKERFNENRYNPLLTQMSSVIVTLAHLQAPLQILDKKIERLQNADTWGYRLLKTKEYLFNLTYELFWGQDASNTTADVKQGMFQTKVIDIITIIPTLLKTLFLLIYSVMYRDAEAFAMGIAKPFKDALCIPFELAIATVAAASLLITQFIDTKAAADNKQVIEQTESSITDSIQKINTLYQEKLEPPTSDNQQKKTMVFTTAQTRHADELREKIYTAADGTLEYCATLIQCFTPPKKPAT